MKKVAILLVFMSHFGFSQIIVPDTSKMSYADKGVWYQQEKKSPTWGFFFSFLLPTAGHAYAGDWKRGIKWKAIEAINYFAGGMIYVVGLGRYDEEHDLVTSGTYSGFPDYNAPLLSTGIIISILGTAGLIVWEHLDVIKTVKNHNRQLYKKLFGKFPE